MTFVRSFAARLAVVPALSLSAPAMAGDPVWQTLGLGTNNAVRAIVGFDDDGPGPHVTNVYAGGFFTTAGGKPANRIARWDGKDWYALGGGLSGGTFPPVVHALAVFDEDGAGGQPARLFAAGTFVHADGKVVNNIARWDGQGWTSVGGGILGDSLVAVRALTVFDEDGAGPEKPALYAAGYFYIAGGVFSPRIAKWTGLNWAAVPEGLGSFPSIEQIFALRGSNSIAGSGGQPVLVAGGDIDTVGTYAANEVGQLRQKQWLPVGGGVGGGEYPFVYAIATIHNGPADPWNDALIVGGVFSQAGGVPASNIARWNGNGWQPLGSGLNNAVYSLATFDPDDNYGPQPKRLYAAGAFTHAGSVAASKVAAWDGANWSEVCPYMDGSALSLGVVDEDGDGPGLPALFVGGGFKKVGTIPAQYIARYGIPAPPPCPGDVNGDGKTCADDLAIVLTSFGFCEGNVGYNPKANLSLTIPNFCSAEVQGIDQSDLVVILSNYGCGGCP